MIDAKLLEKVELLAREAGAYIVKNANAKVFEKEGEHNFVTQTDKDVSDMIMGRISEILPGSQIISEESDANDRLNDSLTWVIDPIDGTSNFMYGFSLSAVSIGLLEKRKPVLGVVYNPFTDELFSAAKSRGAYLNGKKIHVNGDKSLRDTLVLAETDPYSARSTNQICKILHHLFQECIDIRITGSAALDMCYIADGRGGAFITPSISPWDVAAGCIILEEAGGKSSQMDGTGLRFTGNETMLAANPLIYQELLVKLKEGLPEN